MEPAYIYPLSQRETRAIRWGERVVTMLATLIILGLAMMSAVATAG